MFFNPLLSLLKAVQIEIALLSQKPSGLKKLKELAASDGGLLTDDLRRRAWPKLLSIEVVRNVTFLSRPAAPLP